jgi:glycine C-acetyltransferase
MKTFYNSDTKKSTLGNRVIDESVFQGNFLEYFRAKGSDIFGRTIPYVNWVNKQKDLELWLYDKRTLSAPLAECKGVDEYGNEFYGPNFGSADYLGLSHHPKAKEAAIKTLTEYGIGSGGSPLAFGVHKYYTQLREELAEHWNVKGVIIYSTGWLAAYGVIKGLIRENDHVILDSLAHNCLREGSSNSTKNIHMVEHLNNKAMIEKMRKLREKYPDDGILCVTEGLFSMDSDTPDFNELQQECKKYKSFLMIDCAHDFGCMGETGKGTWELQNLRDKSNVIFTATGSKSFSTNVGFAGCDDLNVIEYLKIFSTPYMFINSISPIQAATALANLATIRGEEGKLRRKKVQELCKYARKKFEEKGFKCLGYPSPILPVLIGNEILTKITVRLMLDEGVIVNGIEFPVVSKGSARLRVCITPNHEEKHIDVLVETFERCFKKSKEVFMKSISPEIAKKYGMDSSKL